MDDTVVPLGDFVITTETVVRVDVVFRSWLLVALVAIDLVVGAVVAVDEFVGFVFVVGGGGGGGVSGDSLDVDGEVLVVDGLFIDDRTGAAVGLCVVFVVVVVVLGATVVVVFGATVVVVFEANVVVFGAAVVVVFGATVVVVLFGANVVLFNAAVVVVFEANVAVGFSVMLGGVGGAAVTDFVLVLDSAETSCFLSIAYVTVPSLSSKIHSCS